MADALNFSLVPMEQSVTFAALVKGIESVHDFVQAVDYAATRGQPRIWLVESLGSSVPTISIRPIDHDTRIIDTIMSGIASITHGAEIDEPPPSFSEEALEDLKKMRRLAKEGVQRVDFSANGRRVPVRVAREIAELVDRIQVAGYSAFGSLEGELGAVNVHGQPVLTIWERVSRQPIRCQFPRTMIDEVKNLLQRRVRVMGRINYFKSGRPRNISEFRGIVDLTPDPRLPRAHFGSIPDITGGMDSSEYLKVMRG